MANERADRVVLDLDPLHQVRADIVRGECVGGGVCVDPQVASRSFLPLLSNVYLFGREADSTGRSSDTAS